MYCLQALRFIGLLSSNCCKLMPLLTVDPATVLSDLPATLPSLLTDSNWSSSAEFIVNKLWVSTERICNWASQLNVEGDNSGQHQIHQSEAKISAFLSQVMHQTCVILKDYLPLDKQLKLVNLSFCLMNWIRSCSNSNSVWHLTRFVHYFVKSLCSCTWNLIPDQAIKYIVLYFTCRP